MMIRLTPEQVSAGWDVARPLIAQSLPASLGVDSTAMSNVLYSLLQEESQLWVYYQDVETGAPLALIMTVIMMEPVAKIKYLLVYATSVVAPTSNEQYEDALDSLRIFAEAKNCQQIIAYVEDPLFVRKLAQVGGQPISTLVRL